MPVTLPTIRGKLFVIVKEKTVGAKRVQALLQQHGKTLHRFRNKSGMLAREAYRCMCITCIVPMIEKYRQLHKKPDAEGLNVVDQAPAHHAEDTLRDQYLQEANTETKELPPEEHLLQAAHGIHARPREA